MNEAEMKEFQLVVEEEMRQRQAQKKVFFNSFPFHPPHLRAIKSNFPSHHPHFHIIQISSIQQTQ
jgi:hypothetical protein